MENLGRFECEPRSAVEEKNMTPIPRFHHQMRKPFLEKGVDNASIAELELSNAPPNVMPSMALSSIDSSRASQSALIYFWRE